MLLKAGAMLEARTEASSALLYMVKTILGQEDGLTPLHVAAWNNTNSAVVTTLLEAGAALEARTRAGLTPLHVAARRNANPSVVITLLDAGADPKAKTANG